MKSSPEHEQVRARRRAIVHAVIHALPSHSTNSETCIARALATRDGWPEATWPGARKGPPDYQQVLNYMKGLLREGKLRRTGYHWESVADPEPLERFMRRRAAEALRLQAEGKNGVQIAELLEISRSLAYQQPELGRRRRGAWVVVRRQIGVTLHAAARYQKRVRPDLSFQDARRELTRLVREGREVEAPPWMSHLATETYIEVAPGVLVPCVVNPRNKARLRATTVLVIPAG